MFQFSLLVADQEHPVYGEGDQSPEQTDGKPRVQSHEYEWKDSIGSATACSTRPPTPKLHTEFRLRPFPGRAERRRTSHDDHRVVQWNTGFQASSGCLLPQGLISPTPTHGQVDVPGQLHGDG